VYQISQPSVAQQQVGIAQRAPSPAKKSLVGEIVGGVIGGISGFLAILGGITWWYKRRRIIPSASTATQGIRQSDPGQDKPTNEITGRTINDWIPSPISNLGNPTDSYYHTMPSTSPPTSAAAYQTTFPDINSPTRTDGSGAPLFPSPTSTSVKQWVTNLTPTSATHSPTSAVPTQYDYGNDGHPGTLVSPPSPGFGRKS
jgi:hypothetical protein